MQDWTEKYRPKFLDEIVGNKGAINDIRTWAENWNKNKPRKKALIISGKPGIGKTSVALALANTYKWIPIELNTSDVRNAANIKNIATMGAVNESFNKHGQFLSLKTGGRKLIILDEADNLYERIESTSKDGSSYSDKGGKKAIIDTVKITSQPIILIVNDYYGLIKGSGEVLKKYCKMINFYPPYPKQVVELLKKISFEEEVNVEHIVLQTIADRSKGDIRSAVNDLQSICLNRKHVGKDIINVLGYRDRNKIIFEALREIFKTKNLQNIKDSILNLDEDPRNIILWINENIPKEYLDYNDLTTGYQYISQADVFLGRTYRRQKYCLWSYACDLMTGGVAVAKSHNYPNERYNFPTWLRQSKNTKSKRDIRKQILIKIGKNIHCSQSKSKNYLRNYFIYMFRNSIDFAIKMRKQLDLNENEVRFLLNKENEYKIEKVMNDDEIHKTLPIKQEKEKREETKEKTMEKQQQKLF